MEKKLLRLDGGRTPDCEFLKIFLCNIMKTRVELHDKEKGLDEYCPEASSTGSKNSKSLF